MRRRAPRLVARLPLLAAGLGLLAAPSSAQDVADGIAAQVGADIVLISEVRQVSAGIEKEMRAAGGGDEDVARLQEEVLERLIERRLLEQVVKRAELEATEAEVDGAIGAIAQENGLSLEQLRNSVEQGGMPFAAYRERIRGEIERSKVLNGMVRARVRVEESDVRALYDQRFGDRPQGGETLHLRHLLVTFGGESKRSEADACARAEQALGRIRDGEAFERVAAEVSEVNPERGGDVGMVPKDALAVWMAPVVAGLAPGETSDVVRTPFGCNLLQLVERTQQETPSFEAARPRLRAELTERAMEAEYEKFMDKLRAQTFIERRGSFAAAGRGGAGAGGLGTP